MTRWIACVLLLVPLPAAAQSGVSVSRIEPLEVRFPFDCNLSLVPRPADYSCGQPSLPENRIVSLTVDSSAFQIPEGVVAARFTPGVALPFVALVRHDGRNARPGGEEPFLVVVSTALLAAFEAIGPFEIHRTMLPPFGPRTRGTDFDLSSLYSLVVPLVAERDSAASRLRRVEGVKHAAAPVRADPRAELTR